MYSLTAEGRKELQNRSFIHLGCSRLSVKELCCSATFSCMGRDTLSIIDVNLARVLLSPITSTKGVSFFRRAFRTSKALSPQQVVCSDPSSKQHQFCDSNPVYFSGEHPGTYKVSQSQCPPPSPWFSQHWSSWWFC